LVGVCDRRRIDGRAGLELPQRLTGVLIERDELAVEQAREQKAAVGRQHPGRTIDPTCADSGAQVLPPARATVPPSLRENSSRASTLPACCALGPPACAAPCSCRHGACSARSAWPHPGKACPSV